MKIMKRIMLMLSVLLSVLALGGVASAATPDPAVSAAVADGFGQVQSTFTGVIVPLLFTLVIAGALIALAIRKIKQGAKSVG